VSQLQRVLLQRTGLTNQVCCHMVYNFPVLSSTLRCASSTEQLRNKMAIRAAAICKFSNVQRQTTRVEMITMTMTEAWTGA
jgi:hypothetical protein